MTTYLQKYSPEFDSQLDQLVFKPKDVEEIVAAGSTPEDIIQLLKETGDYGDKFLLIHKGKVEGILGVTPHPADSSVGIVFFLTSEAISEFTYSLVKYSRATIDMFLEKYQSLTNYTLSDYESSIRWLTYIGAAWLDGEFILIDEAKPFKCFVFTREEE